MKSHHLLFPLFVLYSAPVWGQTNSWIKAGSGNWEEPQWSLGILPANGHTVMITNTGWKAVAIAASTVQTHPESLNVHSITISSPVDSYNVLLMNFAGLQVPLTVNALTVASNSALAMHSSALRLNGPMGTGMSIGGQFEQEDGSLVTGNQIDVGYIGPGVYNLVSGLLDVGHVWLGGPFGGVLNQQGGTNSVDIIHLEPGGQYHFSGGEFEATVYFNEGSMFLQHGGVLNKPLTVWRGAYSLENGINNGGLTLPSYSYGRGNATALQAGGTNLGSIQLGGEFGAGTYTLSNGVVHSPSISARQFGQFIQRGGSVSSTGMLNVVGGYYDRGARALAYYYLDAGTLSVPGLFMDTANFTQNGGTNDLSGELRFGLATHNFYNLNGGLLRTPSTTITVAYVGGFFQNGGTHWVTNQLNIEGGNQAFSWRGYVLGGGELNVSNLVINPLGIFKRTGGTVNQSGLLTLKAGTMHLGLGEQRFGPLQLQVEGGYTNSSWHFPTGSCTVRFQASSNQPWSAVATLLIKNWAGSVFGNGLQQIYFGNNAGALTEQQLDRIFFENPPGLPPGLYTASLLDSGELVPDEVPPTGRVPPRLQLLRQADGVMGVIVYGEIGARYSVERSSNLLNWTDWTNGVAENGTFSARDSGAPQAAIRYYRAMLLP